MKKKILILCTGNSCRNQMAEAFLQAMDSELTVFSAGTKPTAEVHPLAIEVMQELGFDLSQKQPKQVDMFLHESFDYVITVCGDAQENCPAFFGSVQHREHMGFPDPAQAEGNYEEQKTFFRRIRDDIRTQFTTFYRNLS